MKTAVFNEEVFFACDEIRVFGRDDIEELARLAHASPTGKRRICLHRSPDAAMHEMLIAMRRDVKYPPHKNTASEETHFLLQGEATLVLFSDEGEQTERIALAGRHAEKPSYSRIPANTYHMLEIETDICVYLETKLGPFSPETNVIAPFAERIA